MCKIHFDSFIITQKFVCFQIFEANSKIFPHSFEILSANQAPTDQTYLGEIAETEYQLFVNSMN